MEGDTPSFSYLLPTGLSDPTIIDMGGWGGRFSTTKADSPHSVQDHGNIKEDIYKPYMMYIEASDNGNPQAPIYRWRSSYQNDMAARMDWTITETYDAANHNPEAVVNNSKRKFYM